MPNEQIFGRNIQEVISICWNEPGPRGRRDAALFALAWCGQLSMPEVVHLSVAAAQRVVSSCSPGFAIAVEHWLLLRPSVDGACLLTINRRGRIVPQAMPATTAAEVIRRRAAQAKVGYITPQELLRASVLASRAGDCSSTDAISPSAIARANP